MKKLILVFLLLGIIACQKEQQWNKTPSGIQYIFFKQNSQAPQPQIGQAAILDVNIYYEDSLLFSSKEMPDAFVLPIDTPKCQGCIGEAILMLHQGDSALFKIDAVKFFKYNANKTPMPKFIKKGDSLIVYMKLVKILSKEQIQKEKEKLAKLQKLKEIELLTQYLEENNISVPPTKTGLYYIEKKHGYGKKPHKGDSVFFSYTAKLINGEIVDKTPENKLFGAKIGDSTLYKGVEEGLQLMREGTEATLIIPSKLALGEKGIPNLIPPYSTLIFDIKLKKVKHNK